MNVGLLDFDSLSMLFGTCWPTIGVIAPRLRQRMRGRRWGLIRASGLARGSPRNLIEVYANFPNVPKGVRSFSCQVAHKESEKEAKKARRQSRKRRAKENAKAEPSAERRQEKKRARKVESQKEETIKE